MVKQEIFKVRIRLLILPQKLASVLSAKSLMSIQLDGSRNRLLDKDVQAF